MADDDDIHVAGPDPAGRRRRGRHQFDAGRAGPVGRVRVGGTATQAGGTAGLLEELGPPGPGGQADDLEPAGQGGDTSSVLVPIDPVDPRTTRRRGGRRGRDWGAPGSRPGSSGPENHHGILRAGSAAQHGRKRKPGDLWRPVPVGSARRLVLEQERLPDHEHADDHDEDRQPLEQQAHALGVVDQSSSPGPGPTRRTGWPPAAVDGRATGTTGSTVVGTWLWEVPAPGSFRFARSTVGTGLAGGAGGGRGGPRGRPAWCRRPTRRTRGWTGRSHVAGRAVEP